MPISDLPTETGQDKISCDVLIIGSGPVGMTYAKLLIEAGLDLDIRMVESGSQESSQAAYHKKNEVTYQKDINRFVNVIKSALETVSVPVDERFVATLDPASWTSDKPVIQAGQNPKQKASYNLGAEAVTRGIGGMSTHWTCAIPRFNPEELPDLFEDDNQAVWADLYDRAESLIGKNDEGNAKTDPFVHSIRQTLVKSTLNYELGSPGGKLFKQLPLACSKQAAGTNYINWHSAYQMLKDIKDEAKFHLYKNALCTKLERSQAGKITDALCDNLMLNDNTDATNLVKQVTIKAKYFIVAAGAVLGPQLLVNSGLSAFDGETITKPAIPNLGKFITEQPMAFCQIVLRYDLIDSLDPRGKDPADQFKYPKTSGWPSGTWPQWIQDKVNAHIDKFPIDPLPIPFDDKEPQVTKPYATDHPWHTQIHRDAFSYGEVAASIDSRLVVDLRFFGKAEPREGNTLTFQKDIQDGYGMPQPTFSYNLRDAADDAARDRNHLMMRDMTQVAAHLGGYLPGSEPQFMEPGLALHLGGTMRAGKTKAKSVVNPNLQVWDIPNLYLAGNGVLPTAFAANPTLSSIALAVRSANTIIDKLRN